jgi:uncharacterized MnhB-related membrane protein
MSAPELLQIALYTLVAAVGAGVIASRDPLLQAIAISLYGLVLALLFVVLQAPDVALSLIVVGAVALPPMIVLALAKVSGGAE